MLSKLLKNKTKTANLIYIEQSAYYLWFQKPYERLAIKFCDKNYTLLEKDIQQKMSF